LTLISPIPVASGLSTLRVIPILAFLAVAVFMLRKNSPVDINLLIFGLLYLLLVVLSVEAITMDENYRLMYVSTLIVAFALPVIRFRDLNNQVLMATTLMFFTLVLLNAGVLLTSAFSGGTRLDVLVWQKETAFVYGINKFLTGLFAISVLFAISDVKRLYKFLIVFLYVVLSVFYGSRSHSLLATVLFVLNATDVRRDCHGRYVNRMVKGAFIVIAAAFLLAYFIDYNVVLERASNLFLNFTSSNRWPVFEVFVKCLSENPQLFGADILLCTQEVTYDLDNTFAFVMASSGFAGFAVFSLLLLWSLYLLYKSRLGAKWVAYIFFSMLVILNVDILVYRPVILLPLFVYMVRDGAYKKQLCGI
jgi:hypothetical protein